MSIVNVDFFIVEKKTDVERTSFYFFNKSKLSIFFGTTFEFEDIRVNFKITDKNVYKNQIVIKFVYDYFNFDTMQILSDINFDKGVEFSFFITAPKPLTHSDIQIASKKPKQKKFQKIRKQRYQTKSKKNRFFGFKQ